ncbi:tetratricopeptide repeat protein [Halarcobacter anaerophilus]|jgi:tetratricopeptide (TPR) repeat protein|uniref:Uncharacterized protein n=1 Tax=Halarcobacter anaerophilus TaxID=877500 RepID=A0A4Q0XXQ7_9BACT|nr:tetratricopeptide repeat protein [Halarcobacter anaerophilus]QDF28497.1 tetratricopeptide repeat protein [Halarcobacter anaerophilus]RXJ61079.1 hypothetical protein CRV06_14765 [Halarcobacter anaerophilus]
MKKIYSLLFVFTSYLFSSTLSIGSLDISYKITNDIDDVYLKNKDYTLIIQQNNLWNNAKTELNLFSGNKEKIQISMHYIGNKELGYIYTFKNIDNKLTFSDVELYQLDGGIICKTEQIVINKTTLKLVETDKCKPLNKVGISLDEISYVSKNFKLKNILSNNEIKYLLNRFPFTLKNVTQYNNIAYYLQKAGANKEAIYLLEKIIEKYPNRIVAYINLGDAYWDNGDKIKAKEAYKKYIELMKKADKEKRIPIKVEDRIK